MYVHPKGPGLKPCNDVKLEQTVRHNFSYFCTKYRSLNR